MSGTEAEKPVSVLSQALEHGGPAVQAVEEEQGSGWVGGQGQRHSAAESSLGFGAEFESPPPAAAVKTAGQKGGLQQGHWPEAALQATAVVGCVSWRHSAQEVLWKGHTAAGSASVQ